MSSVNNKHIDGDVSVGRNMAVGGVATIQGDSHFKGRVKIDGWLEAKNVKGANKGMFTSVTKLREAYPLPHDGWWAVVGETLPGPIYVGDGGEWVATGQEGGNPTIDGEQYYGTRLSEIEAALEDIDTLLEVLTTEVSSKVDKESGKGLSTNDFTDEDKRKLDEAEETKVTPQAQVSTTAESKEYVYSTGGETEQTTVMSMGDTTIAVQGDSVVFRKGMWNPAGASGQYVTVPIPGATSTHAGVMSAADKVKLDSLEGDVSAKLSYAFLPFNGIVLLSVTVEQESTVDPVGIYWVSSQGRFAAKGSNGKFYANWIETEDFALRTHYEQYDQILYVCEGELYAVISGALVKLSDSDKVDKVSGKGLSTNDFTSTLMGLLNRLGWVFGTNTQNIQQVAWDSNKHLNTYTSAGVYRIVGIRTGYGSSRAFDGFPIENAGDTSMIDALLYVLDSSLGSAAAGEQCCVTQILVLSNRVGRDGHTYTRTARAGTKQEIESVLTKGAGHWSDWGKLQTNVEVGVVSDAARLDSSFNVISSAGLDTLTDNGIYSGVYASSAVLSGDTTKVETFVMVVINNYAVAGSAKTITQVKFATLASGAFTFEQRQRKLGSTSWSAWESVTSGGDNSDSPTLMTEYNFGNLCSFNDFANAASALLGLPGLVMSGTATVPQFGFGDINGATKTGYVMARVLSPAMVEFDVDMSGADVSAFCKVKCDRSKKVVDCTIYMESFYYRGSIDGVEELATVKSFCEDFPGFTNCTIKWAQSTSSGSNPQKAEYRILNTIGSSGNLLVVYAEKMRGGSHLTLVRTTHSKYQENDWVDSEL